MFEILGICMGTRACLLTLQLKGEVWRTWGLLGPERLHIAAVMEGVHSTCVTVLQRSWFHCRCNQQKQMSQYERTVYTHTPTCALFCFPFMHTDYQTNWFWYTESSSADKKPTHIIRLCWFRARSSVILSPMCVFFPAALLWFLFCSEPSGHANAAVTYWLLDSQSLWILVRLSRTSC